MRKGGITREPDFIVETGDGKIYVEFQYVNANLNNFYFNFKKSKVVKKGNVVNTKFLCLISEEPTKYALLDAQWIYDNAELTTESAWGNRSVYRITGDKIKPFLKDEPSLEAIWNMINAKFNILEFKHKLIDITKDRLSYLLQEVVDENKIVSIIPNNLDSFFKICFILDNINRIPKNGNLWLIYILTYINNNNTLSDIYKITYCIDFLYSKISLNDNEIRSLVSKIKELIQIINKYLKPNGTYISSVSESPLDETRYALFSIDLIEDIIQDLSFYYDVKEVKSITRIYENVKYLEKTNNFIKNYIE